VKHSLEMALEHNWRPTSGGSLERESYVSFETSLSDMVRFMARALSPTDKCNCWKRILFRKMANCSPFSIIYQENGELFAIFHNLSPSSTDKCEYVTIFHNFQAKFYKILIQHHYNLLYHINPHPHRLPPMATARYRKLMAAVMFSTPAICMVAGPTRAKNAPDRVPWATTMR
jgi:uncharacterized protein YoaH (UPF0181 family)